jgi:hypothetical protein
MIDIQLPFLVTGSDVVKLDVDMLTPIVMNGILEQSDC